MAEGRYSTLLAKVKKGFYGPGMTKLKSGWKYENGAYVKIWSGATVVSYYDGDTLIGTEDVDEGEDVLHPSFSTSKEGYTLYGWTTDSSSEIREETLTAEGEAMTLYALYLPNALTIAQGSVTSNGYWADYTETLKDSKYITGEIKAIGQGYNTWGGGEAQAKEDTQVFNLNLGLYENAAITVKFINAYGASPNSSFDGASVANGNSKTVNVSGSGNHTLWVKTWANYNSWASAIIGVTSIVLTEPQAWE